MTKCWSKQLADAESRCTFGWSEQDKRAETGKARFVLILLTGLTPLKVPSECQMRTGCAGFVSSSTGAFCSVG